MSVNNEIITYFKITGEFNLEDITKALNLTPCKTWRKGDKREGSKTGEYTFSLWEFGRIERENNLFCDEQMKETVLPLFEKVDTLIELKRKYNLTYVLEVVPKFYTTEDKPILSPLQEVVEFCALTQTLIDIDYYFYFESKDEN